MTVTMSDDECRQRALEFVQSGQDPSELGDLTDPDNFKILWMAYRIVKAQHSRSVGMRAKVSREAYILRKRYASLLTSHMTLKRKHEGEEAAARWKKMYDERMAKSDAKRAGEQNDEA